MRQRQPRRSVGLALVAATALLVSSCVVQPMTVKPSSRPLPESYTEVGPTKASSWSFFMMILIVPFGWGPEDPAGEARDLAIEKAGADALVDVTCDVRVWILPIPLFPLVLFQSEVEGKAVQFNE